MDSQNLSPASKPESPAHIVDETAAKSGKRKWLVLLIPIALLVADFAWNYVSVGMDAHNVTSVPGNGVVSVRAHHDNWVDPSRIVFDLTGYSGASKMDVFRVLLQFAERQKQHQYSEVILSKSGKPRFVIPGAYFQTLGEEYSTQNPMYTVRTFPTHLSTPSGNTPFSEYEGGILGVLTKELDQFNEMMEQWME
jgi:hypothetical protein